MEDEKPTAYEKTVEVSMAPNRAVALGTPPPEQLMAVTAAGHPDVAIDFIPISRAIMARAGGVFFQTMLGGLGVAASGSISFMTWKTAVAVAASATLVNIAQSLVTIFSDLEKRFPLLRA